MVKKLEPIHPGEILLEDFLKELGISQNRLAIAVGVDIGRINAIIKGKRAIERQKIMRLLAFDYALSEWPRFTDDSEEQN